MKLQNKLILLTCGLMAALPIHADASDVDERAVQSRQLVKEFAGRLQGRLKSALEEGGPVNAIGVCKISAPEIAANLSTDGWRIGRTALKTRNPNNRPDAWEFRMLEAFEDRKAAGEDVKTLEHFEDTQMDGKTVYRYMKAIPTGGLCLTCHGSNLQEDVQQALRQNYPQDQATGFSTGDIRGAFTLIREN